MIKMLKHFNDFQELCNSPLFEKTALILLFTHFRLFEAKLRTVPLNILGPDFNAFNSQDANAAYRFLSDQFCRMNTKPNRNVYTYLLRENDHYGFEAICGIITDAIIQQVTGNGKSLICPSF